MLIRPTMDASDPIRRRRPSHGSNLFGNILDEAMRGLAVPSERYLDTRHLERRAVKMWDLGRPSEGQRRAPQIIRRGHD